MNRLTSVVVVIALAVGPALAQSSAQSRQSYQQKVQSELDKISAKVVDLRSRFEKAGSDSRKELDTDTEALQKKIDETRRQLDALQKTTDSQWDSFRKNLDQSLSDVRRSYKTTEAHFKKKSK